MKNITVIVLLLFFAVSCNLPKQEKFETKYKNIITKYTEIKEIFSQEVDDTFYVYVRLPKYYLENPNKRYPVLYLLDGDIAFNMSTSIVRYLQYGKDLPDMIIIGIGYGTMLGDNEQNLRERDYTISQIEQFPKSGGADKYLRFLEKELIPMIESSYRTNDLNILNGYSLGGLFTIYTLVSNPNLFDYYIAGSPYLVNDIDWLVNKTSQLSKFSKLKRLFVSVGETENHNKYHNRIKKITEKLKYVENIELKFVEFENGTHFTCPAETMTYGLKFIFEKMK